MVGELEVGGAEGLVLGARLGSGHHVIRRERILTGSALARPVTDGFGIALALLAAAQQICEVDRRHTGLGGIFRHLAGALRQTLLDELRVDRRTRPARLGRAHDHALLVDPDHIRNVHHTEKGVELMVGVEQRWVLSACGLDVLA